MENVLLNQQNRAHRKADSESVESKHNPTADGIEPVLQTVRSEQNSDVTNIGWKEIILTRQEFDMLRDRLKNPTVEDSFDRNWGVVLPLFFFVIYTILIFKDEWNVSEFHQNISKFLLFVVAVFYIGRDKSFKKMGVNFTSQIMIAFCFGGLLVAASSVV